MNRNTMIGLCMLYALWESNRQDLLDLIKPFILYSVGNTTATGDKIDPVAVGAYLENEFGYRSFQIEVVNKVLAREARSKRLIKRKEGSFYLTGSLSGLIDEFSAKRTVCKEHSDAVTNALTKYFNNNHVNGRNNYTQAEAETFLLSFFEQQGSAIILSVDNLRQIMVKNNEVEYYIGKFILAEHEKSSALMDYLIELVKGYFVTTALYLQAENNDVTRASFSDVVFFLDTRLLLALLGYKTEQENNSVQAMVNTLQRHGAKLACFSYNEDELYSILEAYKLSTIRGNKNSNYTLEYFDAHNCSSSLVEIEQRRFKEKLKEKGITSITPEQALTTAGIETSCKGILDSSALQALLLKINPEYNTNSYLDDFTAIDTVSRIREGKYLPYIEKCKAVFATTNTTLVNAMKQYMKYNSLDFGFPIIITGSDLCVLAWLKDFEQENNLPKMRLLENVLAALTPSKDLMDTYISILNEMENVGNISSEEVALLRVDLFARNELMEITHGAKDKLTPTVIETIRTKMREESYTAGVEYGRAKANEDYRREKEAQRNAACKRAEEEIESEYKNKERKRVTIGRLLSITIAIIFIAASIISFSSQWSSPAKYATALVAIVATYQGTKPFFSKDNWIIKRIKQKLQAEKLKSLDKKKTQYLEILNNDGSE